MAYLRKKSTSPYYFACFPSPDGTRWLQRSTKCTDRAKATRLALEWERASRRGITESQARRVLSEIHELIHDEPLASATVSEYAKGWLARKKLETRSGTYPVYAEAVGFFLRSLRSKASGPLAFVTAQHIVTFRDAVSLKSSASTANKKLKVVRGMFASAWREGFISENPAAKVGGLDSASKRRRPLTLPEIQKLLAVADDEWRGMILAGMYTGQRLGDLARLTWAQIDLTREEITFHTGKTGRMVCLPLAKSLTGYLMALPGSEDPTAPIFPCLFAIVERTGRVGNLSNRFGDLLAVAGLVPKRTHAKKKTGNGRDSTREPGAVSFHCLRHTATSLLKNAGVPEAVVRDIIGHESAAVSRVYTHMDTETKRAALAKLPEV